MIRLLATTALGLVLANAALAQSPAANPNADRTQQSQSNSTSQPSNTARPQQAPSQSQPQSGTPNTTTSQQSGNPPASQQSANPPPANSNQAQDRTNAPANTGGQAQQAPPANQAQQAPNAAGSSQAQQAPNATGTNQTQQTDRAGASSQTAARTDSVNISKQQETKIGQTISRLNVRPVTNVNFSLNVGTVVPRDVQLSTLPPDVVEIVPQYRGYSFALVKDEIVVVDPATYKIVTVLPYSGQSTATTTTRERSASKFSDRDREVIRKHAKTRSAGRSEARTTGSTARTDIRVGDHLPESVEVEEFPSTVYRDAPDLREYRYIHRDTRTYVIEPRERRVIEEID
ncbi:DUF1236 domain-containing protein [Bradyrhizobium liaoningense]|uniref:DUF1236 domain-containing protein n=1 Tax=Bradyrhizobium liaoningense TaxID=43992 RepID=UPI001BA62BC5|nr:DUF1236 domain-containing protein [Bradyrhizobium liaoningense]MBR0858244.1 DUF1236 domain-containing protein [Bradyrhizobium liaoningense]